MTKAEKNYLTRFGKGEYFNNIMKKLMIKDRNMTYGEKSYILYCALLFAKVYQEDKRYKSYIDFSYHIIINYSLLFEDYEPLYDFSVNFGLFPISRMLYINKLLNDNINKCLIDIYIDNYNYEDIVETYEQKKTRNDIINCEKDANDISFIAPTSYGKSDVIIEHISSHYDVYKKIAIIVPTKSLLSQTYKRIKDKKLNSKIILHDEMYNDESMFIAILTQERALRMIEKYNVYFDLLYIDESHKLFLDDYRSILLSRLIKKSKLINTNINILYFSPLVNNSDNLKISEDQIIDEYNISMNMKDIEYNLLNLENKSYRYNKFIKSFFYLDTYSNIFDYICKNSKLKNFFFLGRPIKIEQFSKELFNNISYLDELGGIEEIIEILKKYVHEDFYINKYLKKGLIYLHGKLPDQIKEYLEYKFKKTENIKYLIGNSVILEGVNLPIDSLFILNLYKQKNNDLINLIGRVNRLSEVFIYNQNNLNKLLPPVHFIDSVYYNRENSNFKKKLESIRSDLFEDEVDNPILTNYKCINKNKKEKHDLLKKEEDIYFEEYNDDFEKFVHRMIAVGINNIYNFTNKLCEDIYTRIKKFRGIKKFTKYDILDKVHEVFIKDLQIEDNEFKRLNNEKARSYYKMFMEDSSKTLREQINKHFWYIKNKLKDNLFYVGESYGEETFSETGRKELYVDVSEKKDDELINLIIVKIKVEEDFIRHKLSKFFQLMYDYGLIQIEEYNFVTYGTTDENLIDFLKTGLPINIIVKLQEDDRLNDLYLDSNNNISFKNEFISYMETLDDFMKFQLEKYL